MSTLSLIIQLIRINSFKQMLIRLKIEFLGFARHTTLRKILNLCITSLQSVLRTSHVRGYPYRYYIEPTNACNLRCPFCLGWQERSSRRKGMMSLESFQKIVDEITPYTYWIDLYNRGEPLVNPAAIEMIAYAHAHNIAIKLSTNLHLLDAERVEQLIRSGLDYLVVPLDGGTQETYEKYRVGGDFETVLCNLRLIVEKKRELNSRTPYITIRTLIMKHNEHEMDVMRALARDIGVDNLIFTLMIANIEKDSVIDEWLPTDENYSWYDYQHKTNKITGSLRSCSELWQRMTINWDGSVFPCCFVDEVEMSFGNTNPATIEVIWNNKAYTVSRRVFDRDYKPKGTVTVCSTCRGGMKRK